MNARMTRSGFLRTALAAAVGTAGADASGREAQSRTMDAPTGGGKLLASAPVLLNPAERSIDVAFAIGGADASGWVEISETPDMARSVRIYSGSGPLMKVNSLFATVRIHGLRPATRYWYRIGADRIKLLKDYQQRNLGAEVDPKIHSFRTLGAEVSGKGGFCVIQDTHANCDILGEVLPEIAAIKPAAIIWNGDARNFYRSAANAVDVFLRPHPAHPEYASGTPVMFLNGNHDYRGRFALHLEDLVPFRDASERSHEYAALGRNFVQRIGDIALIGMDTGEDKLDTNPVLGGITRMKAYRELQARWLAEEIEKPAVATARFKVAFCHIPLYDPDPRENPGDVEPDDSDPRYKHPWAAWQRTCANLWGPLFDKAGVALVCTGHQHRCRLDGKVPGFGWKHLIGGERDVIHGRVESGRLVVTVRDARRKAVRKQLVFT